VKSPLLRKLTTVDRACLEQTISLYHRSNENLSKGEAKEFVEDYLEALQVQNEHTDNFKFILPPEFLLNVMALLPVKEILGVVMLVDRSMYRLCRAGSLWMQLFAQHWPDRVDAVGHNPLTIDWFSQFQKQFVALKQQQSYDARKRAEAEGDVEDWVMRGPRFAMNSVPRVPSSIQLGDIGAGGPLPVVLDVGSGYSKIGMCNDVAPKIYPTVYGGPYECHVNYYESWGGLEAVEKERKVREAGEHYYKIHFVRPIHEGHLKRDEWQEMEVVLSYLFNELAPIKSSEHPLLFIHSLPEVWPF